MTLYNMRIIIKNMVIILAYNQKINYNVRIIIKIRTNIHAHNLGGDYDIKKKNI